MLGQPRLAVVGQQPQHHLQAAALDPRAGLAWRDLLYELRRPLCGQGRSAAHTAW